MADPVATIVRTYDIATAASAAGLVTAVQTFLDSSQLWNVFGNVVVLDPVAPLYGQSMLKIEVVVT